MAAEPGDIRISTACADIHCRVEGREHGPWVTCLHSLATNLHLWDREAALLGRYFRVLRLDMRGHGQSSCTDAPFTVEDLGDDVVRTWDELGIARSAVLGLSIGGMVALVLGLDVPSRVSCLVAADCRADAPESFVAMWTQRKQLAQCEGMASVAAVTLPTWFTPATLTQQPPILMAVEKMIGATSVAGYLGAAGALQKLAVRERLPAMTRPTLFLVGAEDGIHPQAMAEMQACTPGSILTVLPEASHLSNLEQPDAFVDAILPFIRSRTAEAP
jgi:3-oxoadipate enol-lactonase